MGKKEMVKYVLLLHVTMILVGFILFSMGTTAWAILGTLVLLGCCVLMFREGCAMGERACALKASLDHTDKAVDSGTAREAYKPSTPRKAILTCAIVPLIISLVYLGVYFTALNTQGHVYGQEGLEEALEQMETPETEGDIADPEASAAPETTVAPEGTLDPEASLAPDAGVAGDEAQEDAGITFGEWAESMSSLDMATLILRLVTFVLALPFWPVLAFWQSQYVTLSAASITLLVVYPFVWPSILYLGYLQGPKLWKHTEEAMVKGKRRAKARSRIVKKNKNPRAQKPMI